MTNQQENLYMVQIEENMKGTGRWYHFGRDQYDYIHNEQKVPGSSPPIYVGDKIIGEYVQVENPITKDSAVFMNGKWVATDPHYTSNPSEVIVTGLNTCFAVFVVNKAGIIALHMVTESKLQPQQLEKLKTIQRMMKTKNWTWQDTHVVIIKTSDKHDVLSTDNQLKTIDNINLYFGICALVGEIDKGTCTGTEALIFTPA